MTERPTDSLKAYGDPNGILVYSLLCVPGRIEETNSLHLGRIASALPFYQRRRFA